MVAWKKKSKVVAEARKEQQVQKKDFEVILSPVVTEKSANASHGDKRSYVFKVLKEATKTEILNAVERVFEVKVDSVRTMNVLGKQKRTIRGTTRRPSYKKAYVTLKSGEEIKLFDAV